MKRENLLAATYAGPPMMFQGVEIVYSPLANEIIRLAGNALFTGDREHGQSHQGGLIEAIMIMYYIAVDKKGLAWKITEMDYKERNRQFVKFYMENEEEVDAIKPQLLKQLESYIASSVESEDGGKPTPDAAPAS